LISILIFGQGLLEYLRENPWGYLDEMVAFIYDEYDVVLAESTVYKELRRVKWSRKKVKCVSDKYTNCRLKRKRKNAINDYEIGGRPVCASGNQCSSCPWTSLPVMKELGIKNMDGHH
jgi:hypothetical protein